MRRLVPIFDLDGTLLDSDEALVAPFVALGIARERISFGEPVAEACQRLGVSVDDYVGGYDPAMATPFPGVADLVAGLDRWAVCSNKDAGAGVADLARWQWAPEVALFTDAFAGGPKRLEPVLAALELAAGDVVYVGDSDHDRRTAEEAGCRFLIAGWNPRAAGLAGGVELREPADVLAWLDGKES